jgi:nicotinate-nucleotide adenylyltransferase
LARIGILGGTFNPPHNGHVKLAQTAQDALVLDRLVVVPAARPPHKAVEDEPGVEVRFALCEAAFRGIAGTEVSRLEIDRNGPSWMVDTLSSLQEANLGSDLFLILGEDAAMSLPSWKDPEQIVSLAKVAWVARADETQGGDVVSVVKQLGARFEPVLLEMEPVAMSSTKVRGLAGANADLAEFVPPAVSALISEQGLYHRRSV